MNITSVTTHRFDRPLWFGAVSQWPEYYFTAEQRGKIWMWKPNEEPVLFMDLNVNRTGNEEGLLGFAFHPEFEQSQRVFAYYSSNICNSQSLI